ncbi:hypothetical protein [Anaerospora hongkongensis]|uniref:hypothetical protein n=1 Tax=Anaerospora hongkongensis TaxID=244830 RepID=UPI00289EE2E1|nr:hypothetical protein [Anaerospora hongkongensis]
MLVFPVANGVLPRPQGGRITGMFVVEQGGQMLADIGVGNDIVACPWVVDEQALYPVGVVSRIADLAENRITDAAGADIPVLIAVLEGREHVRWHNLKQAGHNVYTDELEELDWRFMRKEYPVVSGAGWMPEGGYTEFRDSMDIPVTVYGKDLQTGQEVSITANLGGLVTQEQAHTIEHAMIRSLRTYCLCTPRTLADSIVQETDELKKSLDFSIRYSMPETLGLTASGACGNAMTNMAQIYLAHDFVQNLEAGKSLNDSLAKARKTTMSQLTQDLGLTMQSGLRVLQGLKKGMSHDDTRLRLEIYKKVIRRFPISPWE